MVGAEPGGGTMFWAGMGTTGGGAGGRLLTTGGDLQTHRGAGVLRHLHAVLFARVFIQHMVRNRAVFIEILGGAALHLACFWGGRAFNFVAQDGATKHADGGAQSAVTPQGMANGAACNRAHRSTCAGFVFLNRDLLLSAHLARHSDLLNDGGAGNDPANFLGQHRACRNQSS